MSLPEVDRFYKLPPTPIQLKRLLWDLVSELVSSYGARLVPAYTKSAAEGPSVVINLVSRVPGGKTGEMYKPRMRAATVSTDGESVIEYWAQGVRCVYQIDIFSPHPDECDELTDAMEEALRIVTPQLQRHGIDEFYMTNEHGTVLVERVGEQVYRNTLEYCAIFERVFKIRKPAIRLIRVESTVGFRLLVDVPLRRAETGNVDRLVDVQGNVYRRVVSVLYGADVSGIQDKVVLDRLDEVPLEYGVYVPGVDFVPSVASDGDPVLIWTDVGRRPQPGAVYYLTFRVLPEGVSLSSEGGSP